MRVENAVLAAVIVCVSALPLHALGEDRAAPSATAKLSFVRGVHSKLMMPANQGYSVFSHGGCAKPSKSFGWGPFGGKPKTAEFEAGQKLVVEGGATFMWTGSVGSVNGAAVANVDSKNCISRLSFTPDAGHSYTVLQKADFNNCDMTVVDSADGQAPASLTAGPATCESLFGPLANPDEGQ